MPTLNDAVVYARTLVRDTNSQALDDSSAIQFSNDFDKDCRRLIVQKRKSLFIAEGDDNVVSGTGVFLIPDDILLIKQVEIDLTGQGKRFPVFPIDASNPPNGASLQWLRQYQPPSGPLVDFRGDRYEIFPTPTVNVTDGLHWQGHEMRDPYTSLTDEVTYPFNQDVYAMAYGIAGLYLDPLDSERAEKLLAAGFRRVQAVIDMIGAASQIPVKQTQTNRYQNGWNK